jgi:DNA-binding response OmpR family regulator
MSALLDGLVVLVVEDDDDALALLTTMMANQGAVVMPAPDALSALETLTRIRPNVLVSDMSMPERDGGWLVTEARSQGLLDGVPALLVTALPMTTQEVLDAGFDAYLCKPVDPSVLCETVHALVRPSMPSSAATA